MTINKAQATALWNNGLVDREIAEQLNCITNTVWKWRKDNDLPSNNGIFNHDPHGYVENRRKKRERGVAV